MLTLTVLKSLCWSPVLLRRACFAGGDDLRKLPLILASERLRRTLLGMRPGKFGPRELSTGSDAKLS